MACGKAVVLRDIPVFEEFFTDGEDCLKCESRAEFRAALDRLAENPDTQRTTRRGRARDRRRPQSRTGGPGAFVGLYREVTTA